MSIKNKHIAKRIERNRARKIAVESRKLSTRIAFEDEFNLIPIENIIKVPETKDRFSLS